MISMIEIPEINLPYIRKVLNFIKNGPRRRFDMQIYIHCLDTDSMTKKEIRAEGFPACGTKACFAGWGVLMQLKPSEWKTVEYSYVKPQAQKLFGFTDYEADIVFCGEGTNYNSFSGQLKGLRDSINEVLKSRGLRARV